MIEPKEITIRDKRFTISKIPAFDGLEIVMQLTKSPLTGDISLALDTILKLVSYTAVTNANGQQIQLVTKDLANNHVSDWEMLKELAEKTAEYNCSFFPQGGLSNFLKGYAKNMKQNLAKTLTLFLQQLSTKEKQPSTN
jgi:hypothetical protein